MTTKTKPLHGSKIFLLVLTAFIWGVAFVAQSVSMDYIEPLTFICIRFFIGGIFLIPVICFLDRVSGGRQEDGEEQEEKHVCWGDRYLVMAGAICGVFLFSGSLFQQIALQHTSVGKAGFLTAFYIIIVPVFGIFLKRRCGALTWVGVFVALLGLYFLCINESWRVETGDFLLLIGACMYSGQIMVIDHFNPKVDGVKMSCYQFLTAGVLGFVGMIAFEHPQLSEIFAAAVPVLYTGIMSTGVGYTLQIVGQKDVHPAVASLILSLESVFSALAGFVLLGQRLSSRELLGCLLMFVAIILAQVPDISVKDLRKKKGIR